MSENRRDRVRVMNGSLTKTSGGLTSSDLKYNKRGRIVSAAKSSPMKGKLKEGEFYCVACRGKVKVEAPIKAGKARVTGQPLVRSYCKKCDNKVVKFVKA